MSKDVAFKFYAECDKREREIEAWYSEDWPKRFYEDCPILQICQRCGNEFDWNGNIPNAIRSLFEYIAFQFFDSNVRPPNDSVRIGDYYVNTMYNHFHVPIYSDGICKKCFLDIAPILLKYRDVCELDLHVKYLERAISCRKQFLKLKVKSKQQANLEQCLSMPPRVFSMATWSWTEQTPSIN